MLNKQPKFCRSQGESETHRQTERGHPHRGRLRSTCHDPCLHPRPRVLHPKLLPSFETLLERKVLSNSNILQETYKNLSRKKHNRITEIIKFHPRDTTLHLSNDPEPKIAKQASRTMRQTSLIIEHQGASLYTLEKGKSADPSSKPSHS